MKYITEQTYDGAWAAYTEDYDGAPDAPDSPVGFGKTESAALADLMIEIECADG